MKNVTVLLRENVKDLGMIGDIVDVAPGYARNYLLPRRIAVEATADNVKSIERRKVRYLAEVAEQEAEIQAMIVSLGNLTLTTSEKADEMGTLYGSVNAATIVRLMSEAGFEVDEKKVRLAMPIKAVGSHQVPIHVHDDRLAAVTLVVEAQD
jgi:large subunit ribosomal protein L9